MSEVDPVRPPHAVHDPLGLTRGPPPSSSEFQEVLRRQSVEKSDAEEQKKRKRNLESQEEQKAERKTRSSEKADKETKQQQVAKKKGSFPQGLPIKMGDGSAEEPLPSPAAAPLAKERLSLPSLEESTPLLDIEIGEALQLTEPKALAPDEHIGEVLHHPNPPAPVHMGEKKEFSGSEELSPIGPAQMSKMPPTPVTTTMGRVVGQLPPQIAEIFERMAGVMTIMNDSGMRQTTIELTSAQFAKSPYFGSKIVIQEFTSAPKVFNIMLFGSPQAVNSFQSQLNSLQAAFQAGDYAFRVHRLETSLIQEETPVLERKESASHDEQKEGEKNR